MREVCEVIPPPPPPLLPVCALAHHRVAQHLLPSFHLVHGPIVQTVPNLHRQQDQAGQQYSQGSGSPPSVSQSVRVQGPAVQSGFRVPQYSHGHAYESRPAARAVPCCATWWAPGHTPALTAPPAPAPCAGSPKHCGNGPSAREQSAALQLVL